MTSLLPFADFLKLSVPVGEQLGLTEAITDVVVQAGGYEVSPGFLRLGSGIVRFGTYGQVGTVSVSGDALAALRAQGLFLSLLAVVGEFPHRVTGLDVAFDVPRPAPRILSRVYKLGQAGSVSFSRKAVARSAVRRILSAGLIDGRETGTVYLGSRKASIFAKVYDKRQEMLSAVIKLHGSSPEVLALNDPGPLTRYELTFGRQVGLTLRDVAEPALLFWSHVGDLLQVPPEFAKQVWEPHAEGYELPPYERQASRQLLLLLDNSADIKRAAALAHELGGPPPLDVLATLRSYLLHGYFNGQKLPVRA